MKPGVFITFDVECSMGGAWRYAELEPVPPSRGMMGQYGKAAYGLPLICDILEKNSLKATFFLEPFNRELGHPGKTGPVCRFLAERGQDVQLHVHPNHYHYGLYKMGRPFPFTDSIAELPSEKQRMLVEMGANRIARWTGTRPVAFRAGNMGASEKTLEILPSAGIWIDSSYTFPFAGGKCRFASDEPYNGSKWYGDVLETSLSGFRQKKLPGLLKPSQPVDLVGASFEECRDAVKAICDAGADAVAILHSFSLFKVKDVQYNGGRLNRIVKRRFERFCQWLNAERKDYPVRTFSQLARLVSEQGYRPRHTEPCVLRRPFRALLRRMVQGVNNLYWI